MAKIQSNLAFVNKSGFEAHYDYRTLILLFKMSNADIFTKNGQKRTFWTYLL